MIYEKWLKLFPEGKLLQEIPNATTDFLLPLGQETYLSLAKESLTPREQALIQHLTTQLVPASKPLSIWQRYLEKGGKVPQSFSKVQFIHLCVSQKHKDFNETEWLHMLSAVVGDVISVFACFPKHYTIVVQAHPQRDLTEEIQPILATIEEDFAISMKLFIGNTWQPSEELFQLYQAEKALFVAYLHESNKKNFLEFAPTLLWGMYQATLDVTPIPSTLQALITHDEVETLIEALWTEKGTLTKAANRLFVHRNTLQYRIERFYEHSGLLLKNMDVLTLCHLLMSLREY